MSDDTAKGLIDLGHEQRLRLYLTEIWQRRQFALLVPAHDIRAQNMDTALGQLWHILNPAAMVAVYYLIFGVVLDGSRGVDNYLGFLVVGVLFFQLSQRVMQDSAACMTRNEGLIRSIQFPRALLPISTLIGQTMAFMPALGVLFVTLFLTGETPRLTWLALPAVLAGQSLLNVGGGLITARLGSALRDLNQILPHLFRLLFYLSGVLFSVEAFVSNPTYQDLFALNPLYAVVSIARWSLLGLPVTRPIVVSFIGWSVLLPVAGLLFFRGGEHRYGA